MQADVIHNRYSSTELINTGYTTLELLNYGYVLDDFIGAHVSISDLKALNYNVAQVKDDFMAGYKINEFVTTISSAPSIGTLNPYGFSLQKFINASYTIVDVLTQFNAYEVRENGNVTVSDKFSNGVSAS